MRKKKKNQCAPTLDYEDIEHEEAHLALFDFDQNLCHDPKNSDAVSNDNYDHHNLFDYPDLCLGSSCHPCRTSDSSDCHQGNFESDQEMDLDHNHCC